MDDDHVSTGKAAEICHVTPDTVLKWIKKGRLRALRTPGGHYRVSRRDLVALHTGIPAREVRLCWEAAAGNGDGGTRECEGCIVYRSRARRCYELARFLESEGVRGPFCSGPCESCEYLRTVRDQGVRILVLTPDPRARAELVAAAASAPFRLAVAGSVYELSAQVSGFLPDYVVLDDAVGPDRLRELTSLLHRDERLRPVRVLVAVEPGLPPPECRTEVLAQVEKPLGVDRLQAAVERIRRGVERTPL